MGPNASLFDAVVVLLAFAAGASALACSFVALFDDRVALAAVFGGGGVWLALWAGARAVLSLGPGSRP